MDRCKCSKRKENNKLMLNAGKFLISSTFNNFINILKENNSKKDNISLISFYFLLTTGQKFRITANPKDLFKTVLDKFLSENTNLKITINGALFNAGKIDMNKTLSENNIVDNSSIVLIVSNTNNVDPYTYNALINKPLLSDSISTNSSLLNLNEDDKKLLLNIYELLKKVKENQEKLMGRIKNKDKNDNSCDKNNSNCSHIHIKQHKHGLILLYSNRNWICNLCNKNYLKDDTTYHCSLCNFDVCNCCIGKIKKYPLKPFYHEQTKLQSFEFPCHEHKMIYCRTSRNYNKLTEWICNLCRVDYGDKIWSFYCTNCDYDICLKCSKKYISKDLYIKNISIKIDNHEHRLVYMITNRNWICNICRKTYDENIPTFYCTKCDFDACNKCMKKLSDEQKYPLNNDGDRKSYELKKINIDYHKHPLFYCLTSRNSNKKTQWICNNCKDNFNENEWSFYCTLCDYDLCYNCFMSFNEDTDNSESNVEENEYNSQSHEKEDINNETDDNERKDDSEEYNKHSYMESDFDEIGEEEKENKINETEEEENENSCNESY